MNAPRTSTEPAEPADDLVAPLPATLAPLAAGPRIYNPFIVPFLLASCPVAARDGRSWPAGAARPVRPALGRFATLPVAVLRQIAT
jgi:hypothetical protein